MAYADVADLAAGEALVEVQRMHPRNAEDGVDAMGLEKGNGGLAAGLIYSHAMVSSLEAVDWIAAGNLPVFAIRGNNPIPMDPSCFNIIAVSIRDGGNLNHA
jgi:hypothetical protein